VEPNIVPVVHQSSDMLGNLFVFRVDNTTSEPDLSREVCRSPSMEEPIMSDAVAAKGMQPASEENLKGDPIEDTK
jgi:hypothetical protein